MNGSTVEPSREDVLRTPLATARTSPCSGVRASTIRSASPSRWVRSTMASVRNEFAA